MIQLPSFERVRGEYRLTSDPRALHFETVFDYLSRESYWAKGISRERFSRALENSLCFSLLQRGVQVGFARVTSDLATFAYLADVFVLPPHGGQGLAQWMVGSLREHPSLDVRRWMLVTRDAHGLYEKLGWKRSERAMEIVRTYAELDG
jgi:GNAT superfamily N-acetyltransferase